MTTASDQMPAGSDQPAAEAHPLVRPLSLRANFSWTFVGNIIYAACQWGMVVALNKLGTPEMVGQFMLGLAITAPIIMCMNAQLRLVQATDTRRNYQFGDYLAQRLVTTVLAFLVIIGVALAAGYGRETLLVVAIIGVAKSFESISDIFYGLFQQHERMDRISKSVVIRGIVSLVVLSSTLYLTGSLVFAVIGMAGVWLLNLIFYDARSGQSLLNDLSSAIRPIWNRQHIIALTVLVVPLGVVALLNSLIPNMPRYIIEGSLGIEELGFFASMAYLVELGNTVVMAMGQASAPQLARHFNEHQQKRFFNLIVKLIGILVVIAVTGTLAAFLFGREILTIIYRPDYAERAHVFSTLVVAASLIHIGSFLGYVMTATRYFRAQVMISLATLVGTTLAALLFTPQYGLQGAAYALIVSGMIRLVGSVGVMAHAYYKLNQPKAVEV